MATFDGDVRSAGVTSEKRLMAEAAVRGDITQEILRGFGFGLHIATVTPAAGDDCFLQIQNTSADPLVVASLEFEDAAAEDIYGVTGAAYAGVSSGAAVTPTFTNLLMGSTNLYSAKALVLGDTDLTGQLTTEIEVFRETTGAGARHYIDLARRPVVLGQNQCFSLFAATGGAAITLLNLAWYHIVTPNEDA